MPTPDLCTEEEVHELVHTFYASVRADARLGPIFDAHDQMSRRPEPLPQEP